MDFHSLIVFLQMNWKLLVPIYLLTVFLLYYLFYRLFIRRVYKVIDGNLYVKEGMGNWEEIKEHIRLHHPEIGGKL